MIFVVMAVMVKQDLGDNRVRASCLTVYNAKSEADAKGQFLDSDVVVAHLRDNWRLGHVDALHLPPEKLSEDGELKAYFEKPDKD